MPKARASAPGFNPTLVRLRRSCAGRRGGKMDGFNPTLVRLRPVGFPRYRRRIRPVSIPRWFD